MANTKCLSKYTRNGVCKIKAENNDLMLSLYITLSACSDAEILQEHDKIIVKSDISTVNEIYKNFNKKTETAVIILKTSESRFDFVLDIPVEYHEKVAKFMFKWYDDINLTEVYLISEYEGIEYKYVTDNHGTYMYVHHIKCNEISSIYEPCNMTIKCMNALNGIEWVMHCVECDDITNDNKTKNDTNKNTKKETFTYTLKDFNENKVIISDSNTLKAYDYRCHRIAYSNCVGTLRQYVSVCVDGITISTRTKHCNALRYAIEYLNKNNIKPVETASEQLEVSAPNQSNNPPETEPEDHYYFTNFNDKIFEGFFTSDSLYDKAIELANKYNCVVSVYHAFFHTFCYAVAPDSESETEDTTPAVSAPAEEPEKPPKQLYYFTDEDGKKFFESFETPDDAYWTAKELANNYDITIFVNAIYEEMVDFACPDYASKTTSYTDDASKITEITPEISPSETSIYPTDVPFDMRIKDLCRKCKHLESCFKKDRSNVLEDVYCSEHCDDVCGECTLCCSKFESIHIETIQVSESDDDDLPF